MYATQSERTAAFAKMLDNCNNFDKDVRHTGALDLCNEICKSPDQLEETLEKRICQAYMKHLEDASTEVKSNAVKCIQRTSQKIREHNLIMIVNKLAAEIVAGKSDTLDIFSLTVRGVINESSEQTAPALIQNLSQPLLRGIEQGAVQVKEECLDICTDLFKRFGLLILRQPNLINKEQLMQAINAQLSGGAQQSLRKKASYAMGAFAVILNNNQLERLCSLLVRKIQDSRDKQEIII